MPDDTSSLEKYEEYLARNYDGGCQRFFSPTGFLDEFQKKVEVETQKQRNIVLVTSVDDATKRLEPVVSGGTGVFDLSAEPGTGKTSVLPFRFPTKKVVVAMPTPFDAYSAFNMATGPCTLKLKGLRLGNSDAVVYTDSYMAAAMVLENSSKYDIMIVDECDSDRGCTKFLAEVKVKDKLLIRMSATHGTFGTLASKGYGVTEMEDMPDVRNGVQPVVDYVKAHHKRRSMVLAPDAGTAQEMGKQFPEAVVVSTNASLKGLAKAMVNQDKDTLFIADDVCARGLNLNLDALFDCQLVTEYGVTRVVTQAEAYQRRNRVGRNKSGWYRSPGLKPMDKRTSAIDLVRHNVVRAAAGVPQVGRSSLRIQSSELPELLYAAREPHDIKAVSAVGEVAVVSSPSSRGSDEFASVRSVGSSGERRVRAPSWVTYFSGMTGAADTEKETFAVVTSPGAGTGKFVRRRSSGSSGSVVKSGSYRHSGYGSTNAALSLSTAPTLPSASDAPYAAVRHRRGRVTESMAVPLAPPIMDLTQLEYDMDWPGLLRDRVATGGDLPTLVPPGSWRHTSQTGMGTDWFRRLDDIASRDNVFDDTEFEVVCRAWNRMVAQTWVKRTPGLSSESDNVRMEYCIRYFQAYFMLGSTA